MFLTTLVDVHILARHLDDPDWVVVDCRFTLTDPAAGRRAYDAGHIPGARYAHLNDDLSSAVTRGSGRHPLPEPDQLAQKLGAWGIERGRQVVVYDDTFGAMASRLWWLLRWLGHDAVALLDGGYPRWLRAKLPVTASLPDVRPARFNAQPRNELWVDAETVAAAPVHGTLVVDARGEERFNGDIEPLDKVAGHIPGAINAPYEDNLDLSGEFMSDDALRDHYVALLAGVAPEKTIMMCGSGVTACHNILALEHAGMPGARLYVGSWSEWITDSRRPVTQS
jgi:thiosulfate/3-mercaptopyruvate sulfurtransferase